MKHTRFEENILIDESYGSGHVGHKKSGGIAQHFADSIERYDERKKWHHQLPPEPPATRALSEEQLQQLRKEADSALHADTLAHQHKLSKSGSSEHQWAHTLMKKGAIADRVAAATVLIQESPVHNVAALRSLVGSVKPAKKKDGIVSIDALSELFVSELLVPGVKLRRFEQHALAHLDDMTSGNTGARRTILKLWIYEHQLKELYAEYVAALNVFAHDSVEANKEKAVSSMSYLLTHHPEQEKVLLSNIINKLGDPSQAVASKVIYHLCQLLYNHSNMKSVVLADIEKMLFRSNISPRAQYYGVCFLNQFHLDKDDSAVAESLIRIYFSFFKANIKKGEIDSRLMSAILTGVKRAYPFADKSRLTETAQHVAAVQKIVHLGKFNVAVHALALLFHISDASDGLSDRYYCALYRKLGSAELFQSSHCALLFSLLYKSVKRDTNVARVAAFVRRCVRLATQMSPAHACGTLFLLSQVTKDKDKRGAIKLALTKQEEEEIKEEPAQERLDESEMKEEDSELKEEEEVKSEHRSVKVDLLKGDKRTLLEDESEEEYAEVKTERGWHHRSIQSGAAEARLSDAGDLDRQLKKSINKDRVVTRYDPYARNPAYAGAELAACTELLPLAAHFHPSVRLFASRLLHGELVQYSGDPLKDFSGVRFLDRFAFKNPKKRAEAEGEAEGEEGELKKVKGSHPKFAIRKNYVAKGVRSLPVTSASYLNERADKIPVDELFLYQYLRARRERDADVDSDAEVDSDADSVTSDDFNSYLDKVTGTAPQEESEEELDFLSAVSAPAAAAASSAAPRDQRRRGRAAEGEEGSEVSLDGSSEEEGALSEDEESKPRHRRRRRRDHDQELALESDDAYDAASDTEQRPAGGLFASAEEFSALLEEAGAERAQGTSEAAAGAGSGAAAARQLAWETQRRQWLAGYRHKLTGKRRHKPADKLKQRAPAAAAAKRSKR